MKYLNKCKFASIEHSFSESVCFFFNMLINY